MSERRKSTRFGGEPPPKRRRSTTPVRVPPPSKPKTPTVVSVEAEEGLPRKLKEGGELPTCSEPQAVDLAPSQFQTISESGVLAASIERSRSKWVMEGIFEKYWTKPSKKKVQDASNPAKETMVKLGPCTMIIEPHVFEVTLHTVREPQSSYTFLPPVGQPPASMSGPGYGSPYSNPTSHMPGPATPVAPPTQPPAHANPLQGPLPPFNEGFAHFEPPGPPSSASRPPQQSQGPPPAANRGAPAQGATTNTDPVIQMLASRAATDHELKALMKVVAQGDATADQLRVFQRHIDELNSIIQAQNPVPPVSAPSRGPYKSRAPHTPLNHSNSMMPSPASASTPYSPHTPHNPAVKTEPLSRYYSQPPQYLKSKAATPQRQDITAVVFDFNSGTGDRYLIPKQSIIEYLSDSTQVFVSFLVTRKGTDTPGSKYKEDVDYYEPVTIRLSAATPRILEPLSRVVAPAAEVRSHMTQIMSTMTLANEVYLAIRLPHGGEDEVPEKKEEEQQDLDIPMATYSAPNSLLPLYSTTKG